jgi:predicted nucleic acid-binding protein
VRIGMDTNILIRNAVQSDPQHVPVSEALERLVTDGWELCIGVQSVYEFWVVATRPTDVNGLGLSPEQARQEVSVITGTYTLLRDPPDLMEGWLDLCSRYAVSGRPSHDTRLIALMLAHGVTHFLTLNPTDFTRFTAITCLTPDQV